MVTDTLYQRRCTFIGVVCFFQWWWWHPHKSRVHGDTRFAFSLEPGRTTSRSPVGCQGALAWRCSMAYFRYLLLAPAVIFCSQLASRSAIIFILVPPPAMFLLLDCQLCKQGRRLIFVLFKATSATWAEHPSKDVYFLTPGARECVKLHGKGELRLVVLETWVILEVLCEPGVITRVLTCRRGSQGRENQTDDSMREA